MTRQREAAGLLWPLPMLHLLDVIEFASGVNKVALGTRATSVLDELQELTGSDPLGSPVYFLGIDLERDERPLRVTWRATYLDSVKSLNGGHPEGMRFRPPATVHHALPGATHWNAFVHVCSFEEIVGGGSVAVTELRDWNRKQNFHEFFVPDRPYVVCAL